VDANSGLLFEHFGRLAANDAGTSASVVAIFGHRKAQGPRHAGHGLSREQIAAVIDIDRVLADQTGCTVIPDLSKDPRFGAANPAFRHFRFGFLFHLGLVSSGGERIGFICVLDEAPRAGLTGTQIASLNHIAAMMVADRRREQRHLHLMHVADRALRVDRMLRVVSEAVSCADGLAHLLRELCAFHDATSGCIWQLDKPDQPLVEVSRYHRPDDAEDFQTDDSAFQLRAMTAEAIRRNRPLAIDMPPAEADGGARAVADDGAPADADDGARADADDGAPADAGRFGYVCIPVRVQQQRFGISLILATRDRDLDLAVADISSLADTIRPALLRKVTEEKIRFAAHHDDLTQLSNRLMFQERLIQALASARTTGHDFALLYLDLDGFKQVNDTRGHETGDRLLVGVAERLRGSVRGTDTVARMGGDEFAIIQQFGAGAPSAATLAERLLEAIAKPFELGGRPLLIGASIGIAFYGRHGEDPDVLLRNADAALYSAKRAGRNTFRLYDPALRNAKRERLLIEQDLRDALSGDGMKLAFQPACDCDSLAIVGFEALARWTNPAAGQIEPGRFIPLAESSGLITLLGRWALDEACAEAVGWNPAVTVSVNLSPVQLRQRDLAQQVGEILSRTGLPASRLELEVTEGLLLDDTALVLRTMHALREQGIRLILDDFGTGFASLSYLHRFPFDGLKIDKSFVADLCENASTRAIVQSMVTLGNKLDLTVAVEGIETARELAVVRDLGCRLVQGFLLGKPCQADQVPGLLRESADPSRAHPPRFADQLRE
jgi:diguanylate cyclase (GGDEF)-like protein